MGSKAGMACWLRIQVRQNYQPSSLDRGSYSFNSADGQMHWLGSLLRHHCKQKQPTKIWVLVAVSPSPLLHLYLISSDQAPQIPPVIPMRWDLDGPPRKRSTMLRSWMSILDSLFLTGETISSVGSCQCAWLQREAMWLKWGHSSDLSNVVFPGLCGAGVCFSLTLGSWDFRSGFLSMNSC